MDLEEKHIIAEIKEGKSSAYKKVFLGNFDFLCRYAQNVIKDRNAAEDLVEDFFLKFWENRQAIDIKSNLKAYLLRSVHNRCIDYLRENASREVFQIESMINLSSLNLLTSYYTASGKMEAGELEIKINGAINQLPEACRRIFMMSRFDELSYKEIAVRLEVSVNTVEMQMSRALKKLRKALSEYLHILFTFFV